MAKVLNITNGDCAVQVLSAAGVDGDFLPWRDVLHEGPVNAAQELKVLSQMRAKYIADTLPEAGDVDRVLADFVERDQTFAQAVDYDQVILWFEHDLYDQLQLLQILYFLPDELIQQKKLLVAHSDKYLGELNEAEVWDLHGKIKPVGKAAYDLACRAWQAFTDDSPEQWQQLIMANTSVLPYLKNAVIRLLQQYPNHPHGLCRVSFAALKILAEGNFSKSDLFERYQQTETDRFLGDSVFYAIVKPLTDGNIIAEVDELLSITALGRDILSGKTSALDTISIDRWIGGVHLRHNNLWMWDPDCGRLISASP